MNRDWYKWGILLMWLAFPASAWSYWHVWDRLPARMAVHFDANWPPNGYTSREGAMQLGLGILMVMLVIFTIATLTVFYFKPVVIWPALAVAYVAVGFCWYANYSIVDFNLKAQAAHSELVGTISPARRNSPFLTFQLHSQQEALCSTDYPTGL